MGRSKYQQVYFRSVKDFLDHLPEDERIIVDYLRDLVLDTLPFCMEKLSYNIPHYYGHRRICFIQPAAVPWGNVPQYGVQLGFYYGDLLHDDLAYLEKRGRKQVYVKTFATLEEIETDILRAFLFEAAEIDEMQGPKK